METKTAPQWSKPRFGVLALALSMASLFAALYTLRVQTTEEFLKTLIQAIVQLIGFGGIILAFVYPAQRSLIRHLRRTKRRWLRKLDQINTNPEECLKRGLKREHADVAISLLDHEIEFTRITSHVGLSAFLASFLILGFDFAMLTVHLGLYRSLCGLTIGSVLVNSVFGPVEIPLLVTGIVLLLYAVYRSSRLPEALLE